MLRQAALAFIVACASTHVVLAQSAQNVRGTIASLAGNEMVVNARAGGTVKVEVPNGTRITVTKAFSIGEITPGMKLGVTTVKRPDGTILATEVHPIPPTSKVGITPSDLQPGASMNNGNAEGVAQVTGGNQLTLKFDDGTLTALIVPETSFTKADPGGPADLKPGETVFVAAQAAADGHLVAQRVQVSQNGVKPAM